MAEIIGTNQRDVLEGSPEADTIQGLGDNDTLYGDGGADTLLGGPGDDLYYVDSLEDTLIELPGEGKDTVSSSISFILGDNFEFLILSGNNAINGTGNSLDNILTGNDGANVLIGGDGNDDLFGGGGGDTLNGGSGRDKMSGGSGDDYYVVTDVDDNVIDDPSGGNDTVYTSVNFDLDKTHVETLILAEASTSVNGFGNELDNILLGNSYDNILGGREGDDIIDGGAGADNMGGGPGNDTFFVDNVGDVVSDSVENQGGIDTVYSTVSFLLPSEVEILVLDGEDAINGTGNQLKNILIGNDADNVLNGKDNDDFIDGGLGADTLIGEDGDDSFFVDNSGDMVVESQNNGNDTVYSSVDYALGSDVENLTLLVGGLTGTGNSGNNAMTSSDSADTLAGLAGNDSYYVQNDNDVVIEQSGEGTDTVFSQASNYTLSDNVENLTLSDGAAINGTGNALGNTITGNIGANTLDGAGGNDTMAGNAGDDTYYVDSSGDVVIELAGQGTDTVNSTISHKLVIEVENLTLIGSDDIDGTGNALANTLTGNDGNNVLIGGTGKDKALDTLNGGLGADTLYGGKSKGDIFVFDSALGNGNIDTLADFKKDYIALDADIFTSLTAGSLANGNFVSGKGVVAADSNDFILHDTSTGLLYYDADGSGAGEAVAFAEVSGKLSVSSFTVFDSGT